MGGPRFVRSLTPLIAPAFTEDEIQFNKWLAGFIDGDGYFYVSPHETLSGNRKAFLAIPQALWNNEILLFLREKLGGSIYFKHGNTNNYMLHDRKDLIKLVHRVNGYIRATARTVQFKALCELLNIKYISPITLMACDPYLAGLFDADGSLIMSGSDGLKTRVRAEVSAKYEDDLLVYKDAYKGTINYYPTAYRWAVTATPDVLFVSKCFFGKLKSNKQIRNNLICLFFELKEKKAYKNNSPLKQNWDNLINAWYSNGADIYRRNCKGTPYTKKAREERKLADSLTSTNDDQT